MRQIDVKDLYRADMPFGECCTVRKLGGGYICGKGSSSSAATTTNNTDKRLVTGEGSVGVSADNSSVIVNMTDGGLVTKGLDVLGAGYTGLLEAQSKNFETGAGLVDSGYTKLLDVLDGVFDKGQSLIGQTQKSVADAYSQAQTEAKGTIDNKTMIVLAVAGVAAAYAFTRKGK